jgi:hypothetical protein
VRVAGKSESLKSNQLLKSKRKWMIRLTFMRYSRSGRDACNRLQVRVARRSESLKLGQSLGLSQVAHGNDLRARRGVVALTVSLDVKRKDSKDDAYRKCSNTWSVSHADVRVMRTHLLEHFRCLRVTRIRSNCFTPLFVGVFGFVCLLVLAGFATIF